MRHIMVFVGSHIPQEIHFKLIGRFIGPVCLDIHKTRVVFCIGIHGTQKRAAALVAKARHLREFPHRTPHISRASEQTGGSRAFKLFRLLIADVEDGTHLIAVPGLETSGGEIDGFRQIRIHEAQTLLLA